MLVIDDIQHLRTDEATSLLVAAAARADRARPRRRRRARSARRRRRRARSPRSSCTASTPTPRRQLWASLEETLRRGASGFDAAFARTRGVPLALRREYARARFGAHAWDLATLDAPARAALEALAILRAPVAPAAVAALAPGVDIEAALTSLARAPARRSGRRWPRRAARGRARRRARADRSRRAPPAVERRGRAGREHRRGRRPGPRLAWQAGDDGAFGAMDQITRVREVVWHWLAAGDRDRAADCLLADRELAARSGGAGEFEALLDALGDRAAPARRQPNSRVATGRASAALDPSARRALAALRIEIAVRGGRYTEAFERASAAPGAVSPLLHAELTLASGDVADGAPRADRRSSAATDPSERARARRDARRARAARRQARCRGGASSATLGDLSAAEPLARARVHLATARLDEYIGRVAAMRSALARAHGACKSVPACLEASELSAIVDARRAIGLAREGRLVEAATALDAADAAARDLDAVAVADEVLAARALVARRRGDSTTAAARCSTMSCARAASAATSSARCARSSISPSSRSCAASRRSPPSSPARRWRRACAASSATSPRAAAPSSPRSICSSSASTPRCRASRSSTASRRSTPRPRRTVAVLLATARALSAASAPARSSSRRTPAPSRATSSIAGSPRAEVALAAGDVGLALELARDTAVLAERAHRTIELASALVIVARLELARGDRGNARAAATPRRPRGRRRRPRPRARPRAARAVRARARRRRRRRPPCPTRATPPSSR